MIPLFASLLSDDELALMKDCIDRQWIGIGPMTEKFEKQMAAFLGCEDFVFVNSGSNALQLALQLLDLPEGSEVVLPSFTWIACANAVMLNRLRPVFCDVDLDTCNMRPADVEKKITPRTSAIMAVHYAGKPVDMDGLSSFKLPIVEDAAHAIDSSLNGKHCGTIGEIGIFSFDPVKNITTGEGGGVVARDPQRIERARKLRYCGVAKSGFQASADKQRWWEYEISASFPKMLNSDLAAAIGLAQLKKLPGFQARRKELWNRLSNALRTEEWASSWLGIPPGPGQGETHSYFTYCIRLNAGDRNDLAKFLYDKGIYTSLRFHPLHLNKIYGSHAALPNCEWLNEHALNLPLHHRLSDDDLEKIIAALKEFRTTRL